MVPIAPAGLDMSRWLTLIESAPLVRLLLRAPMPLPEVVVRELVGRVYEALAFAHPGQVDRAVVSGFTAHVRSRRDVQRHRGPRRAVLRRQARRREEAPCRCALRGSRAVRGRPGNREDGARPGGVAIDRGLARDEDPEVGDGSTDPMLELGVGFTHPVRTWITVRGDLRDHMTFCGAPDTSGESSACPGGDELLHNFEVSAALQFWLF